MRRKLVVGNWKMHGDKAAIAELLPALLTTLGRTQSESAESAVEVAVCPPFVYLDAAARYLEGSSIALGAQNLSTETKGAFTGEIAAEMLSDCGCKYVIVGHSERRQLYHESDALVATKVAAALRAGLTPILCVGETLRQREAGSTLSVIEAQLGAVFTQLGSQIEQTVIAYEPVWAIGTGQTATPEQAQKVHAFIRRLLGSVTTQSDGISILYGGSVKADNAVKLFAQPDIDGGLVGGASLNAEEFAAICKAAE
jgi:triosephosphate isomerase (TIM)